MKGGKHTGGIDTPGNSMNYPVAFLWIEEPRSARLATAQRRLKESVLSLGLEPLCFPAGSDLVLFGDILTHTRKRTLGPAFVWCNSDVLLRKNPYDIPDSKRVYGYHRREIPSGETTHGVDMYYIPVSWWDNYLSKDIPPLLLGAGYVDWWISRAMQKAGAYDNLTGYIDHITHPQSAASGSDADPHYQHNFRAYNTWAKRNALEPIPAPPYLLPGIGHVWGVRSLLKKLAARLKQGMRHTNP